MGLKIWIVAFPIAVVLAGCSAPKPAAPAAESSAAGADAGSSPAARKRGIVSPSGSGMLFRECGAPEAAKSPLPGPVDAVAGAFTALAPKPGDGLYVEFDEAGGLARARRPGAADPCVEPVFEGELAVTGEASSWTIEVRGDGIVYRDVATPKGRVYPYAFTRTETGSVLYATKVEKPAVSTLEIAVERAPCLDATSGVLTSFKARVEKDGRKLEGCAIAGVPRGDFGSAPLDELNRFAGTYPEAAHLWDDPSIKPRLEQLLGGAMRTFLDNVKVPSPLMKDAGVFYVTGNKPHRGGSDGAAFLADPASDTIGVTLFVHGVRQDFKESGRDIALPAEVARAIGNMEKH